nr:hypothetical protein [Tanacetum cinerariifolium]
MEFWSTAVTYDPFPSTDEDEKSRFLPRILSNSTFTKDPSKVTKIELTAHMIAVNNQRDSVSPPSLFAKPKKGKYQTMTPTLPKSQGLEALGALSKKRKNPKSEKPPTKTKVTPPKPTKGSEQSHSAHALKQDKKLASWAKYSTNMTLGMEMGEKKPITHREGKGIAVDEQVENQRKLVKTSSIIRSDHDALILIQ